jgi:enamine deaminase RidA (YjgF/YER057c/UK114 family)
VKNQNVDDHPKPGATSMNTDSKDKILSGDGSRLATAEQRLRQLGIKLPVPPEPFGIYAEAVQTGNLLFLTGMLSTEDREAKFIGRVGAELDVEAGRAAARLAALNGLAVAKQHLGSLDKVKRIVRLGGCLRQRQEPLPASVWRRKPSTRCVRRVGNHFRDSWIREASSGAAAQIRRGKERLRWPV